MLSRIIEILTEGISEGNELAGNKLAQCILESIKMSGNLPDVFAMFAFDLSKAIGGNPVIPEGKAQSASSSVRDYRFLSLALQGVRKFPNVDSSDFYGLDFTRKGQPVSSVFLGSNGVGKSSLYASLEAVTLNRMYSAMSRGFVSKEEQAVYLINALSNTPFIRLYTMEGEVDFRSNESPIGVAAYFCSEYDIQHLEQNEVTSEYVCTQIGLAEMRDFLILLDKVRILGKILIDYKEQDADTRTDMKIKTSKKLDLKNDFDKAWGENPPDIKIFSVTHEWMAYADGLSDYLHRQYYDIFSPFLQKIQQTLPILLGPYLVDNDTVKVEVNENKLKISISLQADGETLLSPRLYFNTFRFKLYCVALKLCMAYCAKSLNRCNFPMVIDDVFDSSDFENRYRIRNFIENLVNQHNLLDQAKAYPLQFIFFTQDDLISEGVHRGIRTTMGDENVKYGRIFDYKDKKDADRSTRNILKENDNFINLEDTIR
jgi:hypothetical protein